MTAKTFAIVDAIELENISGGGFPWLPIPDLIRLAGHFWNHIILKVSKTEYMIGNDVFEELLLVGRGVLTRYCMLDNSFCLIVDELWKPQ
ncbi:hypothetical protein BBOH_0409 [Bifidobacterium bohemicum DSM 22767]|uniref:Uncharacterized protein n=1 Tax=Bifidobacterium bohemicum DSM 22767 TaxID=1437606 RepID=A0A086ZK85_9BIFI|nr:hypothetical protein [Bifidobacterium bohemicum]KFI46935.1 hypothetical protein BBOH_0409 [Bifidobacterium bohemicum DSM 22767]